MHSLVDFFSRSNGHSIILRVVILQHGQACKCTTTRVKCTGIQVGYSSVPACLNGLNGQLRPATSIYRQLGL